MKAFRQSLYIGLAVGAVAAFSLLAGCEADETSGTGGTTATGGSGGSAASGGQGGSSGEVFEVQVLATDPNDATQQIPTAGALVAFDLPSGDRVELTTDAQGMVSFDNVDWSAGSAGAVTGYLADHVMESYLGVSRDTLPRLLAWRGDAVLTLRLYQYGEAQSYVAVSGTATNMADDAHVLHVSTTVPSGEYDAVGPNWNLQVPVDQPFSLVGLEHYEVSPKTVSAQGQEYVFLSWAEVEHPAVTLATTGVEIDMSNAMTTTDVSGSYAIPQHGISAFFDEAVAYARTSSAESWESAIFGFVTRSDVAADGLSVEYDLQYVTPQGGAQLFTHYGMGSNTGGSALMKAGDPVAGVQAGVLPEPVTVPSSAAFGDSVAISMNDIDAADTDLMMSAYLINQGSSAAVWYIRMPPGLSEMDLPELPSSLDADTVLGSGPLSTRVELCALGNTGDYAYWCTRWSGSRNITLQR